MNNFGLFRDMIRVQKIMSPPFSAGDCSLRISVYQSTVGGKEHLSLCLGKQGGQVVNSPGGKAMHLHAPLVAAFAVRFDGTLRA